MATTQPCDRCGQPFPPGQLHLTTSKNLPLYFGRLCPRCGRLARRDRRDLVDLGDLETIEKGGGVTA
jgi:hypothetical protein